MMQGMVFADRYRLGEFIGQGGMSLVYRALDIRTGHSVAIKILKTEYNADKEFMERFQREAQAASLMSHHNIVNLLDVGVEGEYRYLVLEYVSGNTLKEIIQQKGRLNVNTAISIAIRILSALQHAHDNGIIHRDIKPQNVLVHSDGHIKVSDFGIARMTNAFTISKGDTVVGSVHYSSPEQATGNVVEATSDIYSTGVVLYEMLTGRVPFTGDTPVSVAMQHIKSAPPPIEDFNPDVPPAVVAVVMKALEKNPKKRYQSAREMADALVKARDGRAEPPPQPQPQVDMPVKPQIRQGEAAQQRAAGLTTSGKRYPVRRRGRKRASWILTLVMATLVFGALAFGIVSIWQEAVNKVPTPDLIGLKWDADGKKLMERASLKWHITEVNHDTVSPGYIIAQLPEAEETLSKGDTVMITISKGPAEVVMPDILGLSRDEAQAALRDSGLTMVGVKTVSTEPLDTVIGQSVEKGQLITAGQEVVVTISGGSATVPDITGHLYELATETLAQSGLITGRINYQYVQDASMVGFVAEQSPVGGTLAILGAEVSLTVTRMAKTYSLDYTLTVPANDKESRVYVVLLENGAEVEQYTVTLPSGGEQALTVQLSSDLPSPLIVRVYIDDKLTAEQEVTLN